MDLSLFRELPLAFIILSITIRTFQCAQDRGADCDVFVSRGESSRVEGLSGLVLLLLLLLFFVLPFFSAHRLFFWGLGQRPFDLLLCRLAGVLSFRHSRRLARYLGRRGLL
jgi:hypothetical protein